MRSNYFPLLLAGILLAAINAPAQHLWWNLDGQQNGTCLYGRITVLATHITTYYCGANWHPGEPAGGYCGIQDNDTNERRTIFSIWDTSPQLHPKVTAAGPQTIFGRFGGEGEGGHTHMIWDWKTNETFQFFVRKQRGVPTNTVDTAYYTYDPAGKKWRHLATINNPDGGYPEMATLAGGMNSFLENFSGQDRSAPRLALYRLWLGTNVENLQCLTHAVGDVAWGELHDSYFLAAGGTNELATVFSNHEPQYGKPIFGGSGAPLAPITDQTLPAGLIAQLENLPQANAVK
jgi:hypothetical protein